jgi:[ribosomal protein S5]-alanine N-acetyltransferase
MPMMDVYADAEVMRYIPGGALPDVKAVGRIIDEQLLAHASRGYAYYAVVRSVDGSVVGDAGFGFFEPTGDIELGYTLARRAWGNGYATEAAAACLSVGLASLKVQRIIAVADVENVASHRVAERVGMLREAEIDVHGRPHVIFVGKRAKSPAMEFPPGRH